MGLFFIFPKTDSVSIVHYSNLEIYYYNMEIKIWKLVHVTFSNLEISERDATCGRFSFPLRCDVRSPGSPPPRPLTHRNPP